MALSAKFKSDAKIQARREYEYKEAVLHDAIRGDKNMFLKARWESKTDNLIVKNIAKNRIEDLRRRQESDLASRRAKLA